MSQASSSRYDLSRENPGSSTLPDGEGHDKSENMCRKYMIGKCKKARKCPYSHNLNNLPDSFCREFIYTYCPFGARCTKKHLNPKEENRREVLRKKYIRKKNASRLQR